MEKPTCAVQGVVRPGAMCASIIVGGVQCGSSGECEHKRVLAASLLPVERECCGTFPRSPHRASCEHYKASSVRSSGK